MDSNQFIDQSQQVTAVPVNTTAPALDQPATPAAPATDVSTKKVADMTYKDIIENDILDLLGLKDLSQQERDQMEEKIMDTIRLRALNVVDENMPEESKEEWQKIGESNDDDQIEAFLKKQHLDLETIMLEQALAYKVELVKLSEGIRTNQPAHPGAVSQLMDSVNSDAAQATLANISN